MDKPNKGQANPKRKPNTFCVHGINALAKPMRAKTAKSIFCRLMPNKLWRRAVIRGFHMASDIAILCGNVSCNVVLLVVQAAVAWFLQHVLCLAYQFFVTAFEAGIAYGHLNFLKLASPRMPKK
jgi:hypothetical protein